MADAGELTEYVNAGKVTITNSTDALTFKQLSNIRVFIETAVTKRQRTDSVLEKLVDLRDFAIEGEIYLTSPELVTWVGYTSQTNNKLPEKLFIVSFTDESGNPTTLSSDFILTRLNFIAPEKGYVIYSIRLESVAGVVGST